MATVSRQNLQQYAEAFIKTHAMFQHVTNAEISASIPNISIQSPFRVVVFNIEPQKTVHTAQEATQAAITCQPIVTIESGAIKELKDVLKQIKATTDRDLKNLIKLKEDIKLLLDDVLYVLKPAKQDNWNVLMAKCDAVEIAGIIQQQKQKREC